MTPVKQNVNLKDYQNLIETICKIECQKLSAVSHLLDYVEMVNIGTQTLYLLFKHKSSESYNKAYLTTAIKWSIRNEVRRRYKWYLIRQRQETTSEDEPEDIDSVREIMYKTVVSIDEMADTENPTIIRSRYSTPDETLELRQLKKAISGLMQNLPERERELIDQKFFKDKKLRELSDEYNISTSRISRIIQSGLNRIKKDLAKLELI